MKIRSIKCYHKIFSPSITIDFSSNNDDLNGVFCIYGNANSGKSLLLNTIANGWSHHVFSEDDLQESYALMDIEFDLDRIGILSVSRTHSPSVNRKKIKDHSKINESTIYGSILYYPINRCFLVEDNTFDSGSTASGVFTICSDIRSRKIQNSVILIDDVDFKMNSDDFSSFYRFLCDFAKKNNNQIITSISDIEKYSLFDHSKRFTTDVETDIINDIVSGKIEIHEY